jgi:hypothetical protein
MFMSSETGELLFSQPLGISASKFILTNLKDHENQVVLAIGKDLEGLTKIEAYPKEAYPKFKTAEMQNTWMDHQQIFFTEIDRASGVI